MIDNIFENLSEFYIEVIEEIMEKLVSPSTTLILATTDEKIADRFCKRKIYFKNGSVVPASEFNSEEAK